MGKHLAKKILSVNLAVENKVLLTGLLFFKSFIIWERVYAERVKADFHLQISSSSTILLNQKWNLGILINDVIIDFLLMQALTFWRAQELWVADLGSDL